MKNIAVVEMEAAGAQEICHSSNIPLLVIRGISDIVGWKRNDLWTAYACASAAAATRALIDTGVFMLANTTTASHDNNPRRDERLERLVDPFDTDHLPRSTTEQMNILSLLEAVLPDGAILVLASDQLGSWVRAGTKDFHYPDDPGATRGFLDALATAVREGLVRRTAQTSYELTGKGWSMKQRLAALNAGPATHLDPAATIPLSQKE